MKNIIKVLMASIVAGVLGMTPVVASASNSVPTRSTAVPNAALEVKNHLEQSTQTLTQSLMSNADSLGNTAKHMAECNAGVTQQGADTQENITYLECRGLGLHDLRNIYQRVSGDLGTYSSALDIVVTNVEDALELNNEKLKGFERDINRVEYTDKQLDDHIRKIANNTLKNETLDAKKRLQLGKLRIDKNETGIKKQRTLQALASHQKTHKKLNWLKANVIGWRDDADLLSYEFESKRSLTDDLLAMTGYEAESHIMLAQIDVQTIAGISQLITQLSSFDLENVAGAYGNHPETPIDTTQKVCLLPACNQDLETWLDSYR